MLYILPHLLFDFFRDSSYEPKQESQDPSSDKQFLPSVYWCTFLVNAALFSSFFVQQCLCYTQSAQCRVFGSIFIVTYMQLFTSPPYIFQNFAVFSISSMLYGSHVVLFQNSTLDDPRKHCSTPDLLEGLLVIGFFCLHACESPHFTVQHCSGLKKKKQHTDFRLPFY